MRSFLSTERAAESYLQTLARSERVMERQGDQDSSYLAGSFALSTWGTLVVEKALRAVVLRAANRLNPEVVPAQLRYEVITTEELALAALGKPLDGRDSGNQ